LNVAISDISLKPTNGNSTLAIDQEGLILKLNQRSQREAAIFTA